MIDPLPNHPPGWTELAPKTVRMIAFPLPSSPAHGLVYMPDSFMSKTFDKDTISVDGDCKLVTATHSAYGPALLTYIPLGELVGFDQEGYMVIHRSAFCASVNYYPLVEGRDRVYADKVQVNSVRLIHRSCHPGSHFVVPEAPYLTALLQYAQSPALNDEARGQEIIEYLSPFGISLFQSCDFSKNRELDLFISRCKIKCQVSYYATGGGLGDWSFTYLRDLRRNGYRLGVKGKADPEYITNPGFVDIPRHLNIGLDRSVSPASPREDLREDLRTLLTPEEYRRHFGPWPIPRERLTNTEIRGLLTQEELLLLSLRRDRNGTIRENEVLGNAGQKDDGQDEGRS